MNRDWYKTATWLMWLALPITAFNYWLVWDRLPMRMAVHFNADWQPNGWTTREGSLQFALEFTAILLVVLTVAAYVVRIQKPGSAWAILITFYVIVALFWFINNRIVARNLNGRLPRTQLMQVELVHRQRSI